MDHTLSHAPLGQSVQYPSQYDASLLFPIPRAEARTEIGISAPALPFIGWDLWNGYEVSWLNQKGLPQVAILRVRVRCDSLNIIESKSFKLYLNSFNQTAFSDRDEVLKRLQHDLSCAAAGELEVRLLGPELFNQEQLGEFEGISLDQQDIAIEHYEPKAELLVLSEATAAGRASSDNDTAAGNALVTESVFSRLLKSNCPVTSQPDWACVQIQYSGRQIDHAGLLKYIVSFRMHNGFHENCVERIFTDIMRQCAPEKLSVFARYTRRGGLDINPWRATPGMTAPVWCRSARQ